MNRKTVPCLCLFGFLLFALCACGKEASSSSDPYAVFDEPPSSAPSAAASDSAVPDGAGAPSSSLSEPEADAAASCVLSVPLTRADGSAGETGLVVLHVPADWSFDSYITFSRSDTKVAEVPALWQAPVSDAMTAPYTDNSFYPEGFGLFASEDTERGGRPMHLLHLKIWLDDAPEPSYMHCVFCETDGFVIEAHVYTAEESGGDTLEEMLTALEGAEVQFAIQ